MRGIIFTWMVIIEVFLVKQSWWLENWQFLLSFLMTFSNEKMILTATFAVVNLFLIWGVASMIDVCNHWTTTANQYNLTLFPSPDDTSTGSSPGSLPSSSVSSPTMVGSGSGANGKPSVIPVSTASPINQPVRDDALLDPSCDSYGVCYEVTLKCTDTKILVNVKTSKPFHGRIYALGRSETCNAHIRNSQQFQLDMSLGGQDCNTQSIVSLPMRG